MSRKLPSQEPQGEPEPGENFKVSRGTQTSRVVVEFTESSLRLSGPHKGYEYFNTFRPLGDCLANRCKLRPSCAGCRRANVSRSCLLSIEESGGGKQVCCSCRICGGLDCGCLLVKVARHSGQQLSGEHAVSCMCMHSVKILRWCSWRALATP
eukprot:402641-Amphidinium_carterae.2